MLRLSRTREGWLLTLVLGSLVALSPSASFAAELGSDLPGLLRTCGASSEVEGAWATVDTSCPTDTTPDDQTTAPTGPEDRADANNAATRECTFQGAVIDCVLSDGSWWDQSRLCYLRVADPPPALTDPVWDGHTDGVILECWNYQRCYVEEADALRIGCPMVRQFWSERAPGQTGPTARQIADDVVASMQLRAGRIDMAPPSYTVRPGSKFVVGIQAWLWVGDPGEHTTGPITRSATAGGITVTATGKLDTIDFDMGDGGTLTCHGPGTKYTPEWDDADSPDCGYDYTRPGDYTITAHLHWTVTWTGGGQSGTIPVDLTTSIPVRVGEIQVLVNS